MFRPSPTPFRPLGPPPPVATMPMPPSQYIIPPPFSFLSSPGGPHSRFPPPPLPIAPTAHPLQPSSQPPIQSQQGPPPLPPPLHSQPPSLPPPIQPQQLLPIYSPQQPPRFMHPPLQPSMPAPRPPFQPPQPPLHFVPPLPGSPPTEIPPPPCSPPPQPPPPPYVPPSEHHGQPLVDNPPRMPDDSQMVHNIEVLAAFVVKNGPEFELMARAKHIGDPKFAFLFGNDLGMEAAIGYEYYKWKKQVIELEIERESQRKPSRFLEVERPFESTVPVNNLVGRSGSDKEVSNSPTLSDMDMEEDYAVVSPRQENGHEQETNISILASKEESKEPSSFQFDVTVQGDKHTDEPIDIREHTTGQVKSVKESMIVLEESIDVHTSSKMRIVDLQLPYSEDEGSDEDQFQEPEVRFDSEASILPEDSSKRFKESKEPINEGIRDDIQISTRYRMREGLSRASRWEPRSEPLADVGMSLNEIEDEDRVSPVEAFEQMQKLSDVMSSPELERSKGLQDADRFIPVDMTSNIEPEHSGVLQDADQLVTIDDLDEREPDFRSFGADHYHVKDKRTVAIDEFGRVKQECSGESDFDEKRKNFKRRSTGRSVSTSISRSISISRSRSRSRSRTRSLSPGGLRWRRRSSSHSPGRRRRWSSRSPRWRRSHSRTPPQDLRLPPLGRGDLDSRSPIWRRSRSRTPPRDSRFASFRRADFDRHERGRRGGRGPVQNVCFNFMRGKCFRGAACWYLHQEQGVVSLESGNRRDLRNRDREWRESDVILERSQLSRNATLPGPRVTMDEAMIEEQKVSNKDIESVSEPEGKPESGDHDSRDHNVTLKEEKHDKKIKSESDKPPSPEKASSEEPKQNNEVELLVEPILPLSLSQLQDSVSSPLKPQRSLSVESPLRLNQSPISAPSICPAIPQPVLSVHETSSLNQNFPTVNSSVQSSLSKVPPMPSSASLQNFQLSLSMGQFSPPGKSSFLQPIPSHQPHETMQPSQQRHQPVGMGHLIFNQPSPPFPVTALPPRPILSLNNPSNQPVYNLSVPPQVGVGPNPPQQHILGPPPAPLQQRAVISYAAPHQYTSGPQPQIPAANNLAPQHAPLINPAVPSQLQNFPVISSFHADELHLQQHGMSTTIIPAHDVNRPPVRGLNSLPQQSIGSLPDRGFHPPTEWNLSHFHHQGSSSILERHFNPLTAEQAVVSESVTQIHPSLSRPFFGSTSSQFTFPHLVKTGGQSGIPDVPSASVGPPEVHNSSKATTPWMQLHPTSLGEHATLAPSGPLPGSAQIQPLNYPLPDISSRSGLLPGQLKPLPNNYGVGDQYDPLADSIEPLVDKYMPTNMHLTSSAFSGGILSAGQAIEKFGTKSLEVPVVLVSGKAIVKLTGPDEAETLRVGLMENVCPPEEGKSWSPGQRAEDATDTGEMEVSKKKTQSKSKKSKEKSNEKGKEKNTEGWGMKMLRTAVAEYVKEVLKPTWREGQMSKEAFKTIAKKAVEKVTGNIPSHHIPKSQEKVDQYISLSRTKIAKLVQGYVDKYLKT